MPSDRWTSAEEDPDRRKRDQYLYRTYRITLVEYEAILELQGGHCALCPSKNGAKNLAVDHDHKTGLVRGLLCTRCNHKFLGVPSGIDQHPERFLAAYEYLTQPPAQQILASVSV